MEVNSTKLSEDILEILRIIDLQNPDLPIIISDQNSSKTPDKKIAHKLKKNRIGMNVYEMPESNKKKYKEKFLNFRDAFNKILKKYNTRNIQELFEMLRTDKWEGIWFDLVNSKEISEFLFLQQESIDFIMRFGQPNGFFYDRAMPYEQEWLVEELKKENIYLTSESDYFYHFGTIFKPLFGNEKYTLESGYIKPHGIEINKYTNQKEERSSFSNNFAFLSKNEIAIDGIDKLNQKPDLYELDYARLIKGSLEDSFIEKKNKEKTLQYQSFTLGVRSREEGHAVTIGPFFRKINGKIEIERFAINNPNSLKTTPHNIERSGFMKYFFPHFLTMRKTGLLSEKLNKNIDVFSYCLKKFMEAKVSGDQKKIRHWRKELWHKYEKFISPYIIDVNITPQEKYLSGFCLTASKNISNAMAKMFTNNNPEKVIKKLVKAKKLNGHKGDFFTLTSQYDQELRENLPEYFKIESKIKNDNLKQESICSLEFQDKNPFMLSVASYMLDTMNNFIKLQFKNVYNFLFKNRNSVNSLREKNESSQSIRSKEETNLKDNLSYRNLSVNSIKV